MLRSTLAQLYRHTSSRVCDKSNAAGTPEGGFPFGGPFSACAIASLLVLWGVAGRWFLETPNFKSVGAAALLAGLLLRDWRWALAVPLASLAISDWRLGVYQWELATTVYGSTCLYAWLGAWASRKPGLGLAGTANRKRVQALVPALGLTLAGSLQFFLLTNLAVWLWSGWYGPGWSECTRCFVSAVPFYKWTLLGDLTFFAVPLAAWELLAWGWMAKAEQCRVVAKPDSLS